MDELMKMWEYQKVDLKITAMENKLKGSDTRKKLMVARNYLKDAQQNIKNMEAESSALRVSYDTSSHKMETINERIDDVAAELSSSAQEMTMQDVDRLKKESMDLRDQLNRQERELLNIIKSIEKIELTMKKLIANVPRAKNDFEVLRKMYESESAQVAQESEPLRKELEAMEPELDAELLEHYKSIKKRCANPLSPVVGGQCTGCNMELPSAAQKKLAAGSLVECDNCGRILFIKD
ncbi:MAG: C4-type zinc ribbon domain-containing protein [Eubacteriales bacterium]|nr:C4-type zinc ribbon domain-containing protein [Eubacteriales bacterium]